MWLRLNDMSHGWNQVSVTLHNTPNALYFDRVKIIALFEGKICRPTGGKKKKHRCNPTLKANTQYWVSTLQLPNITTKGDVKNTNGGEHFSTISSYSFIKTGVRFTPLLLQSAHPPLKRFQDPCTDVPLSILWKMTSLHICWPAFLHKLITDTRSTW